MSDVLASREYEVATPTTIHEWIDSGSPELSIDLLESVAKQLISGYHSTEVWPGSPELLIRLLQSDYIDSLDKLVYEHPDTGEIEAVGRLTLAHLLRPALVSWEIAKITTPILEPITYTAAWGSIMRPTPRALFDTTFFHDIGKSQTGLWKPWLLSQKTVFKPEDKVDMFGHAEIGEAMLKDLDAYHPDDDFVVPAIVSKVARHHHALHPRAFTNKYCVNPEKNELSERDKVDVALMYAIALCAITDSADSTYFRPYMKEGSKPLFRFPAYGNTLQIEKWASTMISFPPGTSIQTHKDFEVIVQSLAILINESGTMTNKIFRPDASTTVPYNLFR